MFIFFFFSSRRRHTRCSRDWSSDVCSSDLYRKLAAVVPNDRSYINNVTAIEKEQVIEAALAQFTREDLDSAIRALSGALSLYRSEERRVGKECRSRWWP